MLAAYPYHAISKKNIQMDSTPFATQVCRKR